MIQEPDPTPPAPPKQRSTLAWATGLVLATAALLVVGVGINVFLRTTEGSPPLRTPRISAQASVEAAFLVDAELGERIDRTLTPNEGRELLALLEGSVPISGQEEWRWSFDWPPVEHVPASYLPSAPVDVVLIVTDPEMPAGYRAWGIILVPPRYAQAYDNTGLYRVGDANKKRLFEVLLPLLREAKKERRASSVDSQ